MENFIEKLKTVDKKVWIGVGIGAAVLVIIIVALVIGLGNNKPVNGDTQGTQYGTETEGGVTEVFGTEEVTEVFGTEMATETEMGTETEMSESESQSQGGNQSQGGTTSNVTVTQNAAVNGVEQKPVTKTEDGEEILGLGSKDQPYEVIPDLSTMSVTTVEVPAGKTLYYDIQRVGGMYLNIDDSDLYVIDSAGKRHDSSFVVEDAMANEFVSFQIGNDSGSNKAFTIKFSNLKGTYQNPEEISGLSGRKSLSSGDEDGWYYRYTATQTGKIRFYISYTAESDITVTNLSTSAQRNFESDGNGNDYIELDVTSGDRIMIQICAKPDSSWEYPATDIEWSGEYAE